MERGSEPTRWLAMTTGPARKRVIVLDDDPGVLKAVQRLLTAGGFDCELFSSVQDFEIRAQPDSALCLVLDINLNGESGIDVRRRATLTWPLVPVIFITGNDSESTRRAAMESGCIAYLVKPFLAEALMNALERAYAVEALSLPHQPNAASAPPSPQPSGYNPSRTTRAGVGQTEKVLKRAFLSPLYPNERI
jgi:FixJ family two-component response regulator